MQLVDILFTVLDFLMLGFLSVTAIESYRIYMRIGFKKVIWLIFGFAFMAVTGVGFIIIDFMPVGVNSRFLGEMSVALRVFPMFAIYLGMRYVRIATDDIMNTNKVDRWNGEERRGKCGEK